jgi:superoxide dismutase, Cu-Zn family
MKHIKTLFILIMIFSFGTLIAQEGKIQKAVCEISSLGEGHVTGTVTFTVVKDGIKIVADIKGLTKGNHGFHIHNGTDCSKPEGHFNPESMGHGAPPDMMRHVGDLGNLIADAEGNAHYEYVDMMMSFEGKNSIIGHVVIIHAHEDDIVTQPSGNSGPMIACGKIEAK